MPAPPSDRLRRAGVAAALADGVLTSALPLLTAAVTRDPLAVALVVAAQRLPGALVAAGGRFGALPGDGRTTAGALTTVRAVVAGGLVLGELAGGPAWVVLVAAAAVLGHAQALDDARPGPGDAQAVVAHGAGIPLGAVLFGLAAPLPFALDVPLLAGAGLLVLSGPPREPEPVPAPPRPDPAGGGVRRLVTDRRLAVATAARATASAGTAAGLGVVVLLALEVLDTGLAGFGILLAGLAAAAVVGVGVAPTLARGAPGSVMVAAVLLVAAGGLVGGGLLDAPLAAGAALAAGVAFSACAGVLVLGVAHGAAHHTAGPDAPGALRAHTAVVATAGAAGTVAGGASAAWWGLAAAYLAGGGLLGLAALVVLVGKIR